MLGADERYATTCAIMNDLTTLPSAITLPKIVTIRDLSFCYKRGTKLALNGINLEIKAGEFIGITGPAGAGKTTLLSCINGVIPHHYTGDLQGEVLVNGQCVGYSTFRDLARDIGTVFEDPDFQTVSIMVEEEIAFGPENLGIPREEILSRIQEALDKTGINHLRDRVISTLSGGQKQKVAISAVLSMHPKVLLLDDPTSELDPIGAAEVFAALRELNLQFGTTIIIVSQAIEQLAASADRLLVLCDGQLILADTPRKILAQHILLESVGVRIPQVTEFVMSLLSHMQRYIEPELVPITVEESVPILQQLLCMQHNSRPYPYRKALNRHVEQFKICKGLLRLTAAYLDKKCRSWKKPKQQAVS